MTGGGQVPNAAANDEVAFGFNAQSNSQGTKGNCNAVDKAPAVNIHVKCLDVTSLVVNGTHATFFGDATVIAQRPLTD